MVLSSFCSGLIIWILRLGGRLLFEGELELKMLLGLVFAGRLERERQVMLVGYDVTK